MSGPAKACLVQQRLTGDMSVLCKCIRRINIRKGKEMVKLKDNIGSGGKGYKLIMNKLKVEDRNNFLTITVKCWSSLLVREVNINYFLRNRAQRREYMTWQPVAANSGIDVFLSDKVQSLEKAYYLRWGLPCPLPFDVNVNVRLTGLSPRLKPSLPPAVITACCWLCHTAQLRAAPVEADLDKDWTLEAIETHFCQKLNAELFLGQGTKKRNTSELMSPTAIWVVACLPQLC